MTKKNDLQKSIRNNAIILAIFALISTSLVSIVYQLTKDKIESEILKVKMQQLNKLLSSDKYNNSPITDCLILDSNSRVEQTSIKKIHRMRKDKQPVAIVISATAHGGYSGDINLLVALSQNNRLLGVEILSHTETPGLGDKIESRKSNWLHQFNDIDLSNIDRKKWRVKKDGGDFDALTGATITPRAVINTISQSIYYFSKNQTAIFSKTSNCSQKPANSYLVDID